MTECWRATIGCWIGDRAVEMLVAAPHRCEQIVGMSGTLHCHWNVSLERLIGPAPLCRSQQGGTAAPSQLPPTITDKGRLTHSLGDKRHIGREGRLLLNSLSEAAFKGHLGSRSGDRAGVSND